MEMMQERGDVCIWGGAGGGGGKGRKETKKV